jgi:serine/threonine protein kinase
LDKYILGEKIGEGAHGIVKKCYDKDTNKLYAVKTIRLDSEHILFLKRNFLDIKDLQHRNIIEYKALFLEMNK